MKCQIFQDRFQNSEDFFSWNRARANPWVTVCYVCAVCVFVYMYILQGSLYHNTPLDAVTIAYALNQYLATIKKMSMKELCAGDTSCRFVFWGIVFVTEWSHCVPSRSGDQRNHFINVWKYLLKTVCKLALYIDRSNDSLKSVNLKYNLSVLL